MQLGREMIPSAAAELEPEVPSRQGGFGANPCSGTRGLVPSGAQVSIRIHGIVPQGIPVVLAQPLEAKTRQEQPKSVKKLKN